MAVNDAFVVRWIEVGLASGVHRIWSAKVGRHGPASRTYARYLGYRTTKNVANVVTPDNECEGV